MLAANGSNHSHRMFWAAICCVLMLQRQVTAQSSDLQQSITVSNAKAPAREL
jgi:hypothetical protein